MKSTCVIMAGDIQLHTHARTHTVSYHTAQGQSALENALCKTCIPSLITFVQKKNVLEEWDEELEQGGLNEVLLLICESY